MFDEIREPSHNREPGVKQSLNIEENSHMPSEERITVLKRINTTRSDDGQVNIEQNAEPATADVNLSGRSSL